MKIKVLFATLLVSALMLGAGTLIVSAQGPAPAQPANVFPWTAFYADFQPHQIPATTELWYKFDYAGDRTQIKVFVPNGNASGLEFRVYTMEQVLRLGDDDRGVGRGSAPQVPCESGKCTSVDLQWEGSFSFGGTFFVRLMNPNPVWKSFSLTATGTGVTHGITPAEPSPTPVPTPVQSALGVAPAITTTTTTTTTAPVAVAPVPPPPPPPPPVVVTAPTPSPTPLPKVANDSPYTAIYVPDNRDQTFYPGYDAWYKFDYGGDKSRIFIALANAKAWGLEFTIFTPEQAINFTDNKFIGRGMPPTIVCDAGKCTSNDMVWIGSFGVPGTYFIKVWNITDKPLTTRLHIEGDNINILE